MPTIPSSESLGRVKLRAVSGAQQSYSGRPDSFGSNVAVAATKAGGKVAEIYATELAIQNEAKAKEIDVEFNTALRTMLYDPESGYYSKRGQDAYTYQPTFTQAVDELYKNQLSKAENASQQMMLQKVMGQRVARMQDGVARHASKEYTAYIDGTSVSRISDSIQEAALNYNDIEYVNQMRELGRGEIMDIGERAGKDGFEIARDVENFESEIHIATVKSMIQQDAKAARAYFEENKENIVKSTDRNSLARSLKIAEKGDMATNLENYSQLNKLAAFDVDKFITTDLNTYELSMKDYKKFDDAQKSAKMNKAKHIEKMSSVKRIMNVSATTLKRAGIDTTPKPGSKHAKRMDEFQGTLVRDMEDFIRVNKRAPTDIELLDIVDFRLKTGTESGSGWFNTSFRETEKFLFEEGNVLIEFDNVPDADVAAIKSQYQKVKGREPTEVEVREAYTRALYDSKRRGR